jgi:hypothetical protein
MSDATEAKILDRFQWWSVTELARASERLTPLSLAQIVARYFIQGPLVSRWKWRCWLTEVCGSPRSSVDVNL